jgi:uncharacterized membrane protein
MRKVFMAAFTANVVLIIVSLIVLPDTVASHFGRGGVPNGWMPKESNAAIFLAMDAFIFLVLLVSPSLVFKFPASMINLPNKGYWLKAENKPLAKEIFAGLIMEFGTALFAFMLFIMLLLVDANFRTPVGLNEGFFLTVLAAFLAYTAYWGVKLYRSFRIPKTGVP